MIWSEMPTRGGLAMVLAYCCESMERQDLAAGAIGAHRAFRAAGLGHAVDHLLKKHALEILRGFLDLLALGRAGKLGEQPVTEPAALPAILPASGAAMLPAALSASLPAMGASGSVMSHHLDVGLQRAGRLDRLKN